MYSTYILMPIAYLPLILFTHACVKRDTRYGIPILFPCSTVHKPCLNLKISLLNCKFSTQYDVCCMSAILQLFMFGSRHNCQYFEVIKQILKSDISSFKYLLYLFLDCLGRRVVILNFLLSTSLELYILLLKTSELQPLYHLQPGLSCETLLL